ncbi:MAG TPA: preprotein translocase subunit SecE [Thermomicrobiales bacterium]|jgi:preprotein translocase subunit SecE|nr:preprotein translocase subunit SecE [Thermomicrobiales bacterium]
MSAQRRSAAKRERGGTATMESPRRAPAPRKANSTAAPQSQPQPQSQTQSQQQRAAKVSAKAKANEVKVHPLAQRFERVQRLYRETRAEMTKINWPDKDTTRNLTIVVIGISFVLGILLGGVDYIFFKLLQLVS